MYGQVTDTAASGATSPGGTVAFVSACSVTYTPQNRKNKTQTITGSYGGESSHKASHGSSTLNIAGSRDLTG